MNFEFTRNSQLTGHNASIYCLSAYDNKSFLSAAGDGWIVKWNIEDGDHGQLLASVNGNIFSMLYLHDFNWTLTGNIYGDIYWIDLKSKKTIKAVKHHKKGIFALIRHESDKIISLGGEGALSIWDINSNRCLETLQLSNQSLRCISKHPIENIYAVGASDNNIYILDALNFSLLYTIRNAHENSVFTLCFSPNGKYLLSGGRDAYLRIRDFQNNYEELPTQAAHLFTVNDIAFNPKLNIFATASRDKCIKIWDSENFSLIKVLDTIKGGHHKSVNKLIWSENGEKLISCSDDRSLIIWKISSV